MSRNYSSQLQTATKMAKSSMQLKPANMWFEQSFEPHEAKSSQPIQYVSGSHSSTGSSMRHIKKQMKFEALLGLYHTTDPRTTPSQKDHSSVQEIAFSSNISLPTTSTAAADNTIIKYKSSFNSTFFSDLNKTN